MIRKELAAAVLVADQTGVAVHHPHDSRVVAPPEVDS
jgi:hypothetical protein